MTLLEPTEELEPHDREAGPDRPWDDLHAALVDDDNARIGQILSDRTVSDSLRALMQLGAKDRDQILVRIDPELAADLVEMLPSEQAADLVARLNASDAVEILDELDSDIQADVVGELDDQEAEAILSEMDPEDAADVRRLAEYPNDTAGGLMTAETFAFIETQTVRDVFQRVMSEDEDFARYHGQHIYVVDAAARLAGAVSLRDLLGTRRQATLGEVMVPAISVPPEASLETLEGLFDKQLFLGLPVVDADGRLIGSVARSAVDDAAVDRAEATALKTHGIVGDELRSMPVQIRARRRLAWLSGNIILNIIAASVIAAYEETLAAVIAIAIFLPMVSDMSGCSGNQAVAVSLRELALGVVKPIDMLRVWIKEISVGVINGIVLGVLIAVVAWTWKGNPFLGMVIGLALAINTMISVSIGGVVPLLLKRFNIDPAVASGPLLTTITDVAGFFLVLSLATLFMPVLV